MQEQRSRLSRDREHRMIGGVCAGIARHYDFDPTIVRIIFVLLALLSGAGIIVYLVMWLVIPSSERAEVPARQAMRGNLDEMTERARLAADAARAAAEAARQAADQLAEATRATVAAARDTWQQGSQQSSAQTPSASSDSASTGTAAGTTTADAPRASDVEPQVTSKPGETTPEGSQSPWPPDRALPKTEATVEDTSEEDPRGGTAST
jgi:phage shock protein PspC (stress-responsive transcriptional regulator)